VCVCVCVYSISDLQTSIYHTHDSEIFLASKFEDTIFNELHLEFFFLICWLTKSEYILFVYTYRVAIGYRK